MEQPRWLERLAGGTRLQILQLLLASDRTVQEIAEEIGVSANAIRGHMTSMASDGLVVEAGVRRDTGGKPAVEYAISELADELFPKAYAGVLEGLLAVLEERLGADEVRDILRVVGERSATPADGNPEERVGVAVEVLRSLGATVEARPTDGGFMIESCNCVVSAVSRNDPKICSLAEAAVGTITGGRVHEVCRRNGRPRCAFQVDFPESARSR